LYDNQPRRIESFPQWSDIEDVVRWIAKLPQNPELPPIRDYPNGAVSAAERIIREWE
jgi:hypothetical protein